MSGDLRRRAATAGSARPQRQHRRDDSSRLSPAEARPDRVGVQAIADLLQTRALRLDLRALPLAHQTERTLAPKHSRLELVANPMLERLVAANAVDAVGEPARMLKERSDRGMDQAYPCPCVVDAASAEHDHRRADVQRRVPERRSASRVTPVSCRRSIPVSTANAVGLPPVSRHLLESTGTHPCPRDR